MRALLIFWGLPIGFFWGWYYLSLNDISFGTLFFSRQMHDLMFTIYGNILNIEPAAVPAVIAKTCIVDTFLLASIVAFRRRKDIRAWWARRKGAKAEISESQNPVSVEARSA